MWYKITERTQQVEIVERAVVVALFLTLAGFFLGVIVGVLI